MKLITQEEKQDCYNLLGLTKNNQFVVSCQENSRGAPLFLEVRLGLVSFHKLCSEQYSGTLITGGFKLFEMSEYLRYPLSIEKVAMCIRTGCKVGLRTCYEIFIEEILDLDSSLERGRLEQLLGYFKENFSYL